MANGKNGYWKGFVTGLFIVPGIGIAVTLLATLGVALSGRKMGEG